MNANIFKCDIYYRAPHFYIVKTRVFMCLNYFPSFLPKHRVWMPEIYVESKNKKISLFSTYVDVKISIDFFGVFCSVHVEKSKSPLFHVTLIMKSKSNRSF